MTKSKTPIRSSRCAAPFRATRRHHSTESAEDYTELIAELIEINGEARVGEVAERLGISHVTAIRTIRRLSRDGYVKTNPYKPLALTPKGRELAAFCARRHKTIHQLLVRLGVPDRTARIDAEGIEHHISLVTLQRFEAFLNGKFQS